MTQVYEQLIADMIKNATSGEKSASQVNSVMGMGNTNNAGEYRLLQKIMQDAFNVEKLNKVSATGLMKEEKQKEKDEIKQIEQDIKLIRSMPEETKLPKEIDGINIMSGFRSNVADILNSEEDATLFQDLQSTITKNVTQGFFKKQWNDYIYGKNPLKAKDGFTMVNDILDLSIAKSKSPEELQYYSKMKNFYDKLIAPIKIISGKEGQSIGQRSQAVFKNIGDNFINNLRSSKTSNDFLKRIDENIDPFAQSIKKDGKRYAEYLNTLSEKTGRNLNTYSSILNDELFQEPESGEELNNILQNVQEEGTSLSDEQLQSFGDFLKNDMKSKPDWVEKYSQYPPEMKKKFIAEFPASFENGKWILVDTIIGNKNE